MFRFYQTRKARKAKAQMLYTQVVDQSRQPYFYTQMGVPDTVDGRYEMISLHVYLVIRQLSKLDENRLSQKLFDVFFKSMDKSLREMGVGDLGIPKHMKRMMRGFNGRARNYNAAIDAKDKEALQQALRRNVYGTVNDQVTQSELAKLADYIMAVAQKEMKTIDATEIFVELEEGDSHAA